MRERLNIRLTAAVLVAATLAAGGLALFHRWQVRRHAEGLVHLADEAEAAGRPDRALWLLATYLDLSPQDTSARARYGTTAERLARDEWTRRKVAEVYERVLAEAPDRADIRRRLVRVYMSDAGYNEALAHISAIGPWGDAEAAGYAAVCYDEQKNAAEAAKYYRRAIELDPTQVERYVRLADLLRRTGGPSGGKEADRVVEQMVASNPGSAAALLERARYHVDRKAGDPARDIAAAVALAPDDVEIRVMAARLAPTADAAREHLRAALRSQAQDERLYLALCDVEIRAGNRVEAAAVLRRAQPRFPGSPHILFALANLTIDNGELAETERLLGEIARWKLPAERAEFVRARLRMAEGNWRAARTILEAIRPALAVGAANALADADVLLGRCHENLGEGDLALAAYRRAAAGDSKRADAPAGVARMLVGLGRLDAAVGHYRQLTGDPGAPAEIWLAFARLRAMEYLSAPPAARRPADLEAVLTRAAERAPNATELVLIRAEVLSADRKTEEAERVLRDALARHPAATDIGLQLARMLVRHGKPSDGLAVIDALDRAAGATPASAVTRLELSAPDAGQTRAAVQGAEAAYARAVRAADRFALAAALTAAHTRAGRLPDAQRWLREIARMRPYDLGVRLRLFELAVEANDRAQMEEAVREVHRAEGGSGAVGHYTEALLRFVRPQDRTSEGLREARQHLTAAALLRPTWAAIVTSRAMLAEVEGKGDEALADYIRAVELGERRAPVVRRTVHLLSAKRRYPEAARLLQRLDPETDPSKQLLKLSAELSLLNSEFDSATELAKRVVPTESKRYEEHLWQAEIFASAGRDDAALAAFQRATEVSGAHSAPWVALVRYHVRTGRPERAEATFAELRERLNGGELPLAVAQCHEALGQTEKAGEAYRAAVDARPEDAEALRQWFEFCNRQGVQANAVPALRRALAARPPLPPADTEWARQSLAVALALSGDFPAFQEAVRLADEGLAAAPDQPAALVTKARVLATRLWHRRDAVQLLQRAQEQHALRPPEEFLLGQLCADSGAWAKGQKVLVDLLSREGDNPVYLRFFIDCLLRNGALGEAEGWVGRLERVAPSDPAALRLRATILIKRGELRDAAAHLRRAAQAPGATKPGTGADRARVRAIARAADELGREGDARGVLFPLAEALYRQLAQGGTSADELKLAEFLARSGKVDEAVKVARGADGAEPMAVAGALVAALYASESHTDAQLDTLEAEALRHLERAKPSRETANLTGLVHARRGRYADAVQAFRAVVAAGETADGLNNLGYMLVLSGAKSDEVDPLLHKSLAKAGPAAGLLDTRGMAHLAAGRTAEAIADFEQAVDQKPSAVKSLHLAVAYHRAGREKDAVALVSKIAGREGDGSFALPAERELRQKLLRELPRRP